jgi:protein-arginine deiminase
LRAAGKFVFTQFRGPDRAGIQQYGAPDAAMDSLSSLGNLETVPPFVHAGARFPLGRVLRGAVPSRHPDPTFTKMIDAQKMQPAIELDTSWLAVGHVDETLSFVKADSPRGWVALANDARLARQMLQDAQCAGPGAVAIFAGTSAETTIDAVLADMDVMAESAASAAEVDAQLAKLKQETGLTDAEIVRVPFLHQPALGASVAYQPATVNGVYAGDTVFAAPDPHGPVIDGDDIMKAQLEAALAPYGIAVAWIEDWTLYHAEMGEVHCGTNAIRMLPAVAWWTTGR